MTPSPDTIDAAVLVERLPGKAALVTINRPHARNAVNEAVARALDDAVAELEADPDVWVVVLAGAGGQAFCAGADLKEIAAGRADSLRTERGGFAGFVFAERTKPWIAAVNGPALAGGCEIVLACDLIVAAEDARFGLPEVMRGLIAGAGGLFRLPRAIPPNVALELILTAEPIDARRAWQYGLVNRLARAGGAVEEAVALAAQITRNAPLAVRESLRVAKRASTLGEAELRALSDECRTRVRETEDFFEGAKAFVEKRAPQWRGR